MFPREGEHTLRTEDIVSTIQKHGDSVALVLFSGLQYYTGQVFDMKAITEAGHGVGAYVGFDCAHSAGNYPMKLHEWGPDFAAWCTYKYINSGPGGIAGAFVHERHHDDPDLPRFAGWWGHRPSDRFLMAPDFIPDKGAAGFQLSNPPVLLIASLRASLDLFERAGGMDALRAKSVKMTGYLEWLLTTDELLAEEVTIITPSDPCARGAQLSLVFKRNVEAIQRIFQRESVIVDTRKPHVMRVAPAPLYNNFSDVWEFVNALKTAIQEVDA